MDPATAFNVAAGVVQFISFAYGISKGIVEIKEAGQLREVKELSEVTGSLRRWIDTLETDTNQKLLDDSLVATLNGCKRVADEMAQSLETVQLDPEKRHSNKWSLQCYIRSAWCTSRIRGLQERLNQYRQEICTYLVILLVTRELDKATLGRFDAQGSEDDDSNDAMPLTHQITEKLASAHQRTDWLAAFEKACHEAKDLVGDAPSSTRATQISENTAPRTLHTINYEVLLTLRFDEMPDRFDYIEKAHAQTFQWIFRPTAKQLQNFSNFSDWLNSDQSLYWITGKAGSGKSTLMKYISSERRTSELANRRNKDKKLVVARFFFWNAGTKLQKSCEGLLETLLLQCLAKCPELTPQLTIQRWERRRLIGEMRVQWSLSELVECMNAFLVITEQTHNILFLIDGLDEFPDDHTMLIELFGSISNHAHVKTCVSSRPWIIFEDAFNQMPNLRMEDLTSEDISLFVLNKLSKNRGFVEMRDAEPNHAAEHISKLCKRASGVFLWVALVTAELLRGLSNGDQLYQLDVMIESLPTDLESLFNRMLNIGGQKQFEKASEYIQLVRQYKEIDQGSCDLTLIGLAFADEDFEIFKSCNTGSLNASRQDGMADRIRRRLDNACRGLLEVERFKVLRYARVDYIHRTVKEYLSNPEHWTRIIEASPDGFNASASWARANILWLRSYESSDEIQNAMRSHPFSNFVHRALFFMKNAELTGCTASNQLFAAFDETWKELLRMGTASSGTTFEQRIDERSAVKVLVRYAAANQLDSFVKAKLKSQKVTRCEVQDLIRCALLRDFSWDHARIFDSANEDICSSNGISGACRERSERFNEARHDFFRYNDVCKLVPRHRARLEMVRCLFRMGADPKGRLAEGSLVEGRLLDGTSIWDHRVIEPSHEEAIERLGLWTSRLRGKLSRLGLE